MLLEIIGKSAANCGHEEFFATLLCISMADTIVANDRARLNIV